jgi:nucleoside-diphosphate-sugar epimerase
MRVFLTGATGFIGSRIVRELLAGGHEVVGLARSDAGVAALTAAGATVHQGTLEDTKTLAVGASESDAVIHTAFDHNFSNFAANCEKDKRAIEAMGAALKGSDRSLIVTSGTGMGGKNGQVAIETAFDVSNPNPRAASEVAGNALLEAGVNVSVVRLPQVHNTVRQGLVTPYIQIARQKGIAAYVGEGRNRWPAAHVSDVARLYVLALHSSTPGARYHAVAEEGIPVRTIAAAVGKGLSVAVRSITPEQAQEHFGWLGLFVAMDLPASSAITRELLGWRPIGPTLLSDLETMEYTAAS